MQRPYIIAEIGVNHIGPLTLAKECVKAVQKVDANVVKFQYFTADLLACSDKSKADYQKRSVVENISHTKMLNLFEFDADQISTTSVGYFCE